MKQGWKTRQKRKGGWVAKPTPRQSGFSMLESLVDIQTLEARGGSQWIQERLEDLRDGEERKVRLWNTLELLPDEILSDLYWILRQPRGLDGVADILTLIMHRRSVAHGPKH